MANKSVSQVRTRPRGKTWSYIFEAGRDEGGKRKTIEKGGFPTQKAAYEAGVAAYADWKHGNVGITSEKILLKDYLEIWLANVASTNVRPSSLAHYREVAKLWILPHLGGKYVQEITPPVADCWIRKLLREGYSKKTLSLALSVLRQSLQYAVYPAQLIQGNPCLYVKVPKAAPANLVKRTIITKEMFSSLLEACPFGHPAHIPFVLLYHTGMRIGEVLGLAWEDVDLDGKTISVRRQLLASLVFSDPKTPASSRTVIMDDLLVEKLRQWRARQAADELAAGTSYVHIYRGKDGREIQQSKGILPPEGASRMFLLCTQKNGRAVGRARLRVILRAEGGLNCHSFRHTHATALIEAGATPKGVAGRLGHSSVSITQDLYAHNTRALQKDTADLFARIMQTSP